MTMISARLRRDERGAIMIIGLIMAFALVGALWFLLGIGSTLAYRERMQQFADSAAFSAAAVHARDMNIIVGINIVMFVLASIWLILSITYTVMEVMSVYMWLVGIVSCIIGCEAMPAAEEVDQIRQDVKTLKDQYEEALNTLLPILSTAQEALAEGALVEAAGAVGANVVLQSKDDGSFLGTGFSADLPNLDASGQIGKRLGLPIENEKNSALCNHSVQWMVAYLQSLMDKFPLVSDLSNMTGAQKTALEFSLRVAKVNPAVAAAATHLDELLTELRKIAAKGFQELYCSGGIWDKAGPKRMWRPDQNKPDVMEKNASDWMQVYSVIVPIKGLHDNDAERKIGIAGRQNRVHTDPVRWASFKYAQAEYYLDCSGKWAGGDCNSVTDKAVDASLDAAMYRMEWRARLVRVHTPKNLPGGAFIDAANMVLSERAVVKQEISAADGDPAVRDAISQFPSSVLDFINELPAGNFH